MGIMEDQKAKGPRGCFFYGCISGAILLVLILIGALVGLQLFKKMLNQFTDTQAVALAPVALSQPEIEQLKQRVDIFRRDIQTGKAVTPLTLSAEEMNAIIQNSPELKDKLRVLIEGDKLKGQVSVPMDQLGLPMFKNRYLNATATLSLSLNNGALSLNAQDVTVKGKPIPDVYQQRIRTANLLQGVPVDPRLTDALNQLEEIKVSDGKLVIVPKPAK
jgi:hypothetical protein